jgi:VWFA-related protein
MPAISPACIALAAIAALAFAPPVSIPADEIRSHTTPYVPASDIVLRTEVRLVEVPVVVRNGPQSFVQGLKESNFRLFDDGKKQTISSFSVRSSSPGERPAGPGGTRFIALCFDDLHLLANGLKPVKTAAEEFVRTSLAPGDRVAVFSTSRSQNSVFSADVPALIEQIEKIAAAPQRALGAGERCPVITPYEAYQIAGGMDPGNQVLSAKLAECEACYHNPCHEGEITGRADAIWTNTRIVTTSTLGVINGLVDGIAKLPGQRIVVLTSSGFLAGEQESAVDKLMDKARHADVTINSLDAKGLSFGDSTSNGAAVLASGTGGEFYQGNDLAAGFRRLGQMPETTYVLGFAPSTAADGKFHKLRVQLASNNRYDVQHRLGYTASPGNDPLPVKLDDEMKTAETVNGFPISFQWEQWPGPSAIAMVLKIDIDRLRFRSWNGRHIQKLTIIGALMDEHGTVVTGKRSELELSLRDGTLAQLSKTGFTTALTIAAPAGHYLARAAAQEDLDGKVSTESGKIEIR